MITVAIGHRRANFAKGTNSAQHVDLQDAAHTRLSARQRTEAALAASLAALARQDAAEHAYNASKNATADAAESVREAATGVGDHAKVCYSPCVPLLKGSQLLMCSEDDCLRLAKQTDTIPHAPTSGNGHSTRFASEYCCPQCTFAAFG